jgi:hypothetical protein
VLKAVGMCSSLTSVTLKHLSETYYLDTKLAKV